MVLKSLREVRCKPWILAAGQDLNIDFLKLGHWHWQAEGIGLLCQLDTFEADQIDQNWRKDEQDK